MEDASVSFTTEHTGAFKSAFLVQNELMAKFMDQMTVSGMPNTVEGMQRVCDLVGDHEGFSLSAYKNETGFVVKSDYAYRRETDER